MSNITDLRAQLFATLQANEDQAALVMDAAETLVKTLHNSEDPRRCPTLRISIGSITVLARWDLLRGWRDAVTGDAV